MHAGKLHASWRHAWLSIESETIDLVDLVTGQNPELTICTSGHSLGGALATVAAEAFATRAYVPLSPTVCECEVFCVPTSSFWALEPYVIEMSVRSTASRKSPLNADVSSLYSSHQNRSRCTFWAYTCGHNFPAFQSSQHTQFLSNGTVGQKQRVANL